MTAEERREDILAAAREEFAQHGFKATSTEAIAERAGISQPYLFRLFGTKKDLFIAAVEGCFEQTFETFERAAAGKTGEEALKSMGLSYRDLLADRNRLLLQLQAYAACDDPDVREVVRRGYGRLYELVERASGADADRISAFFAKGMLINVVAAMDLLGARQGWAKRLVDGCRNVE